MLVRLLMVLLVMMMVLGITLTWLRMTNSRVPPHLLEPPPLLQPYVPPDHLLLPQLPLNSLLRVINNCKCNIVMKFQ